MEKYVYIVCTAHCIFCFSNLEEAKIARDILNSKIGASSEQAAIAFLPVLKKAVDVKVLRALGSDRLKIPFPIIKKPKRIKIND